MTDIKKKELKALKEEQGRAIENFASIYNQYINCNVDQAIEDYEDSIEEAKNDIDYSIDYLEDGLKELFEKYNVSKEDQEQVKDLIDNLINDTANLDETLEGSEDNLRNSLQFNEDNSKYYTDTAIIESIKDSSTELFELDQKIKEVEYQIKYFSKLV